jgi:Flp pilus assembly protein TadG
MKFSDKIPVLGRLARENKGQALVFTALILTAWLGVTGVAVDAGKGYYAYDMLNASTKAAALAGAAGLPDTTTAGTYAKEFGSESQSSSQPNGYNINGMMNNVTIAVTPVCLTSATTLFYAACEDSSGVGSSSGNNAIRVTQTAKVPTWIGPLFGMPTFNISATATASMKGGTPTPYNIAIVLDTTSSMNGSDDGANNGPGSPNCSTQITCAEAGIVTFLKMLVPGSSSAPIDVVSLYVFPGATSTSLVNDFACNGKSPSIVPYTVTSSTAGATTSGMPTGDTYTVISWSNDYKTGISSLLSTSSNLVKAVGGVSGCGATAPGGEGTYYAQVIYLAQADLAAEQLKNHNGNMMIILTDGDATACNTQTTGGSSCSSNQIQVSTCPTITTANGTITSAAPCAKPYTGQPINGTEYSYSTGSGSHKTTTNIQPSGYQSHTYPSALGLCGQAVQASQYASAQGTLVYTIGYASPITGCTTDAGGTTSGSASYGANKWPNPSPQSGSTTTAPCYAIGAMATSSADFFTDNVHGCTATDPANTDITTLNGIFSHIGSNLTSARLVPNNAT